MEIGDFAPNELEGLGLSEAGTATLMKVVGNLGRYTPEWAKTMTKIELAGQLSKPAMGAVGVWLLFRPWGDEEITQAWMNWRTVNSKMFALRVENWDKKIAAIQAAWPEGTDRKAFDKFAATVKHEIQQLENASAQMVTAIQGIQTDIQKIVTNAMVIIDVLCGLIVSSELMQAFGKHMMNVGAARVLKAEADMAAAAAAGPAGAVALNFATVARTQALALTVRGEALKDKATYTKDSSGLILMGSAVNVAVGVLAALIFSMGNLGGLMSSDIQFPKPQANLDGNGNDGKTDFDDIKRLSVAKSGKDGWSYV